MQPCELLPVKYHRWWRTVSSGLARWDVALVSCKLGNTIGSLGWSNGAILRFNYRGQKLHGRLWWDHGGADEPALQTRIRFALMENPEASLRFECIWIRDSGDRKTELHGFADWVMGLPHTGG